MWLLTLVIFVVCIGVLIGTAEMLHIQTVNRLKWSSRTPSHTNRPLHLIGYYSNDAYKTGAMALKDAYNPVKHHLYSPDDLPDQGMTKHFYWKPWIILETMRSIECDSIVLYQDAGRLPVDNLQEFLEHAPSVPIDRRPLVAKTSPCTLDAFQLNFTDIEHVGGIHAALVVLRVPEDIPVVEEWLRVCSVDGLLDQTCVSSTENPYFEKELFSHDQTVLSVLAHQHQFHVVDTSVKRRPNLPTSHLRRGWLAYPNELRQKMQGKV